MDEKKRPLAETIISMFNILIKGQKRIDYNIVLVGRMLEAFNKKYEFMINDKVYFLLNNMTESQAKSMMEQGVYPETVALYSGHKFTIQHLYKLANGGKKL